MTARPMKRLLALAAATAVVLVGSTSPAVAGSASRPLPELPAPWTSGCIIPAVLWLGPSLCTPAPPLEPFSAPEGSCMTPALYTGPQPGRPCRPVPRRREPWPLVPCFTPADDGVIPRMQPGC
jgi:hypothetical protein